MLTTCSRPSSTSCNREPFIHLRAVLRTALNRAVKDGLVLRNAAALTDPVEVPDQPRRFLTTAEALAVLKAAQAERLEALYVLALNVGLRIGEALALRWQDVDLNAGRLSVAYNLQRVKTTSALKSLTPGGSGRGPDWGGKVLSK